MGHYASELGTHPLNDDNKPPGDVYKSDAAIPRGVLKVIAVGRRVVAAQRRAAALAEYEAKAEENREWAATFLPLVKAVKDAVPVELWGYLDFNEAGHRATWVRNRRAWGGPAQVFVMVPGCEAVRLTLVANQFRPTDKPAWLLDSGKFEAANNGSWTAHGTAAEALALARERWLACNGEATREDRDS